MNGWKRWLFLVYNVHFPVWDWALISWGDVLDCVQCVEMELHLWGVDIHTYDCRESFGECLEMISVSPGLSLETKSKKADKILFLCDFVFHIYSGLVRTLFIMDTCYHNIEINSCIIFFSMVTCLALQRNIYLSYSVINKLLLFLFSVWTSSKISKRVV